MKSLMVALMAIVCMLLFSSCATVPPKPLSPGELRLLSMSVPKEENIKLHFPFTVNINFEADGNLAVRAACFYFAEDGPHCSKPTHVDYGLQGRIKVQIRITNPGLSLLECYVLYIREGKIQPSNRIRTYLRNSLLQ